MSSTPDRIRTGATALRGRRARALPNGGPSEVPYGTSTPDRIRTGATALRGQRARPLHNGGLLCTKYAGVPGLEPRTTEPESAVLPITPYPTKSQPLILCGFVWLALPGPALRPARAAQEEHYPMRDGAPKRVSPAST